MVGLTPLTPPVELKGLQNRDLKSIGDAMGSFYEGPSVEKWCHQMMGNVLDEPFDH